MTFAGSIFLIVVGAILRFATHLHVKGLDLHTIGLILMQWAVWTRRSRQSEVLVDDRRVADPAYQRPVGEYRDPPR